MKSFEDWLNRSPAGPKPKKRIARNVRPKPISSRRRRESPDYKRATEEHLRDNPRCQIGPVIRSGGFAVRCLGLATHVHHTRGRGRYYCDKATFLSSCGGECHPQFVHITNVKEATALGLLLPR